MMSITRNLHPFIGVGLGIILWVAHSYCSSHQKVLAETPSVEQDEQLSAQAETAYSAERYRQAINLWLKIIEQEPNPLSQTEIASIQLNIASTFFQIGDYGAAVRHWQKAIETLNLVSNQDAENNRVLATAYLTLGNINILQGKDLQAEKNYRHSWQYASTAQEKSVAQNNLSQLFWARAQNSTMPPHEAIYNRRLALEAAQKAVESSKNIQSLASVDALLQLVRVSKEKS